MTTIQVSIHHGETGDVYRQIVAAVQRVLDPGANVRVGIWVKHPDGRRDIDVSVRGTRNGKRYFVLIECKDWKKRRVGIAVVDALESKRRDLGADVAIIFSNSRFTKSAMRKAERCGIQLASALKAGDTNINVAFRCKVFALTRIVQRWVLTMIWNTERTGPEDFQASEITCEGLPLVNWLREDSRRLLVEHPVANGVQAESAFLAEYPFTIGTEEYLLIGLAYRLECASGWVSQSAREDVVSVCMTSYDGESPYPTGRPTSLDHSIKVLGSIARRRPPMNLKWNQHVQGRYHADRARAGHSRSRRSEPCSPHQRTCSN